MLSDASEQLHGGSLNKEPDDAMQRTIVTYYWTTYNEWMKNDEGNEMKKCMNKFRLDVYRATYFSF